MLGSRNYGETDRAQGASAMKDETEIDTERGRLPGRRRGVDQETEATREGPNKRRGHQSLGGKALSQDFSTEKRECNHSGRGTIGCAGFAFDQASTGANGPQAQTGDDEDGQRLNRRGTCRVKTGSSILQRFGLCLEGPAGRLAET